jgi:hypothetical protein
MDQIDTQRVADITRLFLVSNGTTAITNWKPTDMEDLQVALHNTIMREYPELDAGVRFHITSATRVAPDSPLEVEVELLRVVGHVNVAV